MNKSTLFAALTALAMTASVATASPDARRRDYRNQPNAKAVKHSATVTGYAPVAGKAGTVVTIYGSDFVPGTKVIFDGKIIGRTELGKRSVSFAIPSGARDSVIALRQPGVGTIPVGAFDVTAPKVYARWNASLHGAVHVKAKPAPPPIAPATAPRAAVKAERRLHARRMAKLNKMRRIAAGDALLVQRIERLIQVENSRHTRKMSKLRTVVPATYYRS